jgi:ankyrin repeat protein
MPQIIDCIFVSTEPFTEQGRRDRTPEECFRFCLEVDVYAGRVAQFGFRGDEIPKPLAHVHRVTELVLRVEPCDDLEDFFNEIEWSEAVVEETIEALDAIGADDHARLLATVGDYLKGIEYSVQRSSLDTIREVIANAAEEHLSVGALEKRYGNFGVNDDGDFDRKWRSICLQAVRYMDSWKNFKRVPDGPYNQAELTRYFNSRLALARSLAAEGESSLPNVVSIIDTKAFVTAALNGEIEVVRNMLATGADVDARMSGGTASLTHGATALMVAAAQGHLEIVRLLLAAKASVNARRAKYGETALILAAQQSRLGVVQVLLSAKTNVNAKTTGGDTALIAASRNLHLDVVQTLIAAGADINAKTKSGETALLSACSRPVDQASLSGDPVNQSGHIEVARALLAAGADPNVQNSEGWTALIHASRDGLSDVVRDLLAVGADVNARTNHGFTALSLALSWRREEIGRLLLAANADVHAATKDGQTALMGASGNGFLDLVQALLDAGVDVNEHGASALIGAAAGGHVKVVEALLAAGADVNATIKFGRTALSLASMNGHLEVVRALVAANADVDVKDANGATALAIAAAKGHQEVAQFLRSIDDA